MGRGAELAALRSPLQGDPLIAEAAGLYVHVPFCRVRCPYCDFATAPYAAETARLYAGALCGEAELRAPLAAGAAFSTLYLGGGTPSRLEPDALTALLDGVRQRFRFAGDAECTLEANPEDVDERRLPAWRKAGVTRLSIGVQSADDVELRRLGRVHGAEAARTAALRAAAAFPTWSVDLLYGFPGHDVTSWRRTLEEAVRWQPPHVSAYQFTPEAGTPMGDAVRAGRVRAAVPDEAARYFDEAVNVLGRAGYEHYEISNFARPGHRSRHNLLYWRRRPVLALGPGAVSFWGERRWRNEPDLGRWTSRARAGLDPAVEVEETTALAARETVMLGLRLAEGVPWAALDALGETAAWRAGAGALAARGVLEVDAAGARVPGGRRRLTDEIVVAWWEEAERRSDPAQAKAGRS